MDGDAVCALGALALARAYRDRSLSPVDAMEALIARHERVNPLVNAFYEVSWPAALDAARESAQRWNKGAPLSPLDGVPVSVKDHLAVRGFSTPRGLFHSPRTPAAEDCAAAGKLRAAGLLLFGKTIMPELSVMSFTDSVGFGPTRNPWNLSLSSGGSSGGASAALAANLGPLALGSDGGGSIRHPSAACGLVGVKPTHGLVPYFPTPTDRTVAGPMACSVADAAAMLSLIARPDGRDWTEFPSAAVDYMAKLEEPLPRLRIGFSDRCARATVDADVASCVDRAVQALSEAGHRVERIGELADDVGQAHLAQAAPRFSDWLEKLPAEVLARFPAATHAMLRYFAAMSLRDIAAMQDVRDRASRHMLAHLSRFDVVVSPTSPRTASRVGEFYPDGDMLGADARAIGAFTRVFNLVHLPALSVPCGWSAAGMPVGLQAGGGKCSEALLLRLALDVERWRTQAFGERAPAALRQ